MKTATSSKPAVQVSPLAGRLPTMLPAAARAARIGFDRRFPAWLSQWWQGPALRVQAGRPPTERLSIDLQCAHGAMDIAVDPDQWPALQMAADLPDAALACEVMAALLAPLVEQLAQVLPGAQVRAVRRYPLQAVSACELPMLMYGRSGLGVVRVDASLAAHLESQLHSDTTSLPPSLAALRLPARVTLFNRAVRWPRLRALRPGDVVLSGLNVHPGSNGQVPVWQASISFGIGVIMRAPVEVNAEHARARVSGPLQMMDAGAAEPRHAALSDLGAMADLQLPVAFEVDTARVSLAELAALAPGSVIELDAALTEAVVRLVCNGQTVGTGQLVAIGKQLGVRIERMGLDLAVAGGRHS
jgi:type III secretion protein Q